MISAKSFAKMKKGVLILNCARGEVVNTNAVSYTHLDVYKRQVELETSAGRQVEGFLDVSHFAFVHLKTFGESNNSEVPGYPVELTPAGFRADYISAKTRQTRTWPLIHRCLLYTSRCV